MKRIALIGLLFVLVLIPLMGVNCNSDDNDNGNNNTDSTPPLISGITVSDITETKATISWTTNEPAGSSVECGENIENLHIISAVMNLVTTHSITLSGLEPNTTYHYRVRSVDASDNVEESDVKTFTTESLGEQFTEFYILPSEGGADNYPTEIMLGEESIVTLGIMNHEGQETSYYTEVTIEGIKVGELGPLTLADDEDAEEQAGFVFQEAGPGQEVQFILFKDDGNEPYLRLYLRVDVLNE